MKFFTALLHRLAVATMFLVMFLVTLFFFNPAQIDPGALAVFKTTLRSLIALMLAGELIIIGWLAWSVKAKKLLLRLWDLITLIVMTFADILAFASFYHVSSLQINGTNLLPSPLDALTFSVMAFTGNVQSPYSATESIVHLVTLEGTTGFLFTPILISLIFIVLQDG